MSDEAGTKPRLSLTAVEKLKRPGFNDIPGRLRLLADDIENGRVELDAMLLLCYPSGVMYHIGSEMSKFTVLGALAQAQHAVAGG